MFDDYSHGGKLFSPYGPNNDTVKDESWIIDAAAVGGTIAIKGIGLISGLSKAGAAISSSNSVAIGTNFGKLGTLIKNPGIKIQKITAHGLQRMSERGVTQTMVENWVNTGKALEQSGGKIMFLTQEGVAVVSRAGELITTYGKNYFDTNMQNLVEQLFK